MSLISAPLAFQIPALMSSGNKTLLAPSDAALAKLPRGVTEDDLMTLFAYHTVNGTLHVSDISNVSNAIAPSLLIKSNHVQLPYNLSQSIVFRSVSNGSDGMKVQIEEADRNVSFVSSADGPSFANIQIQVVEDVLHVPQNVTSTLKQIGAKMFLQALSTFDLTNLIFSSHEGLTIFVPIDAALAEFVEPDLVERTASLVRRNDPAVPNPSPTDSNAVKAREVPAAKLPKRSPPPVIPAPGWKGSVFDKPAPAAKPTDPPTAPSSGNWQREVFGKRWGELPGASAHTQVAPGVPYTPVQEKRDTPIDPRMAFVLNHILNGSVIHSPGLFAVTQNRRNQTLISASGNKLVFSRDANNILTVSSGMAMARIIRSDVLASNAVIHIIDAALLSSDSNLTAAEAAYSARTKGSAMTGIHSGTGIEGGIAELNRGTLAADSSRMIDELSDALPLLLPVAVALVCILFI